jgi:succinoglycan biosynthesis transport protein ExoP
VLFDTPPVNMFADALVAAVHADGALLVVRAGKSREDETEVAATQVRALGVPLAGVVLNDFNVERDGRYGNYRYYKYYYTRYYDHYATPELPEAPARA